MVTVTPRTRNSSHDYYVYYNQDTGEITSVGRSPQAMSTDRLLITNNDVARKIVAGVASLEGFIVDFFDEEPKLKTKSEFLESISNSTLRRISDSPKEEWEMRMSFYSVNNKMLIEINDDIVLRLRKYWEQGQTGTKNEHKICVYVALADDYDSLLATISMKLDDLLKNKYVEVNTLKLFDGYDISRLCFFTTAKFTRCYTQTIDKKYDSKLATGINQSSKWQYARNDMNSDIEFVQDNDRLLINRQSSVRPIDLNHDTDTLKCFITGQTPDHLISSFDIDIDSVLDGKTLKYQIDFDIMDVNIMYSMPRLKIRKRKSK